MHMHMHMPHAHAHAHAHCIHMTTYSCLGSLGPLRQSRSYGSLSVWPMSVLRRHGRAGFRFWRSPSGEFVRMMSDLLVRYSSLAGIAFLRHRHEARWQRISRPTGTLPPTGTLTPLVIVIDIQSRRLGGSDPQLPLETGGNRSGPAPIRHTYLQ